MNKKGFTLLETMIILLIVSIVLAFVSYRPSGHLTKEIESRLFLNK
ncbi:prepilin-type N-terminal cleavage/methylation domain-containing protein [Aerococcaceae bacterium WGS1372]